MLPPYWSKEQIELFFKEAGKISDLELAEKMGAKEQAVNKFRRRNNIPSCHKLKWNQEQEDWIRANYETQFNWEMADYLNENIPFHKPVKPNEIRSILLQLKLTRSKKSLDQLKDRRNKRNSNPDLRKKGWDTRGRNPVGVPLPNGRRYKIKQPDGNYKYILVQNYIWKQAHGEIPENKFVEIIDTSKPITIDNLRLRDRKAFELTDNRIVGYLVGIDQNTKERLKQLPFFLQKERLRLELKKLTK